MTFISFVLLNQDTEKQFTSPPMPFEIGRCSSVCARNCRRRDQAWMVSVNPSASALAARAIGRTRSGTPAVRKPLRVKMLMDVSPDLPWHRTDQGEDGNGRRRSGMKFA